MADEPLAINGEVKIGTGIQLADALQTHLCWKAKLEEAVRRDGVLDVETIKRDDCCDLGQWLRAEGKSHFAHIPEFKGLVKAHRALHLISGVVAKMTNMYQPESRLQFLKQSTHLKTASAEVNVAILQMKAVIEGLLRET
jgi:hypothetical protein